MEKSFRLIRDLRVKNAELLDELLALRLFRENVREWWEKKDMTHKAKILWIPAEREYKVICEACGETLLDGVDGIELEIEGECDDPGDVLGIHVKEDIGLEDIFGGQKE